MKKIIFFIIMISTFIFIDNTYAQTYRRGIVTSSSAIYKEPEAIAANRLKSDTGGNISLYSPEAVEVIAEDDNFYKIKFLYVGFIYNGYISKNNIQVSDYEIDDDYKNSLIENGFPIEYATRLSILHAIHPNWTFTPSNTGGIAGGMDFNTAVNGESQVISNNLIDSNNTSLRSTADGAYNNGEWISLSGKGWYAASKQTIAFYLDPRNFLDESHIFMFENLGYNPETQTAEVVNKIIGSSFMNSTFLCIDGAYICVIGTHSFADTFMQAGIDKKVSPVHLASRALQEQGTRGSVLSLGKGYNGEYVGYYNFFNIGAYGKTTEAVVTNGFKYAVARNWNNQYASIYDGSNTIANGYINRGQSTLYYQKFNTIVKSFFSHEYMQNVRAPYSESYSTYSGYFKTYESIESWDDAAYDFLIPIYSNMGDGTTLDTSGNSDATLKGLTVGTCKLIPEFQSSAYEYDCYLPSETTEVQVVASTTNVNAKLEMEDTILLTDDDTLITIGVIAANGNRAEYNINVHKIETDGYTPAEIVNGIGLKTDDKYINNIEYGSDVSNIISSINNKYHFANVKVTNANNIDITDGIIGTGYNISINNAGVTKNYTAVIYGDTTGDGITDIRDLLVVQKHLVKAKLLNDSYMEASDINKDKTVDIRDLLLVQKYLMNQYTINQG